MGNIEKLMDQGIGILLSIGAICDHNSFNDTLSVMNSYAEIKMDRKSSSFQIEKEKRKLKYYNS